MAHTVSGRLTWLRSCHSPLSAVKAGKRGLMLYSQVDLEIRGCGRKVAPDSTRQLCKRSEGHAYLTLSQQQKALDDVCCTHCRCSNTVINIQFLMKPRKEILST